ncbi:aminotransferase class III-fold pyridoxal phosphate-dependent enzyme [Streptomyces sp. NPDC052644]
MSTDELYDRHRRVMPRWATTYYRKPLHPEHAAGRSITDEQGHRYLDFFAGILTNSLGYGLQEFRRALDRQLDTGISHTSTLYLIDAQVRLAERLAAQSGIDDAAVFFVSSGTEANDTALLTATCHTNSNHVVALTDSYHGRSLTTTAVSGLPGWQPSPYTPLRITWASNGLSHPDDRDAGSHDPVADLETRLTDQDPVAALILEPVQGLGGFHTPPTAMLQQYAEITSRRGGILICDEVQTAWGRTGSAWWGHQLHRLRPDVITFAKGIANGLPLGGVIARRQIIDSLPGKSISTFGGNPLSCTAALTTWTTSGNTTSSTTPRPWGSVCCPACAISAASTPTSPPPRGHGLMLAMDLIDPHTGEPDPRAADAYVEASRTQGLLIGLGGRHGNALRIAPPMTVTEAEVDAAAHVLTTAAQQLRPTPAAT